MSEPATLEERVTNLERDVAVLRQQFAARGGNDNWIERISGSMKDFPEFEEAIKLGREFRQQDRPVDDG